MSENHLKEEFEKAIKETDADLITSPEYRRKKLIIYLIRTLIAIALYYFLWDYEWVRWTLIVYIPLNLIGLFIILGGSYFLSKKVERTREKIEKLDSDLSDEEEFDDDSLE